MAGEWPQVALADVVELISGGTPKTSVPEYWGGSIPWLSVVDFNTGYRWVSNTEKKITERGLSESATTILNQGDIIISARGTVGVVAQLAKPMAFNQSCYGIRGKQGIADTNFVYYALQHAVSQMQQVAHGGVFNTITRDTFKIILIKLPPLSEQRAIAHILGTLDDKIELNRKTNETLEAMARALFKSWFVDFDPVRSKVEERDTGLPKEIADLFPDEFEDSELGEIPKGWEPQLLGALAALNPESWTKDNYPGVISYVDLSNTKWGRIEAVAQYTCLNAPARAQRILRSGDTIVGTVRPGNGSYTLITEDGLTGSTGFAVLRPRQPQCIEFVYLAATRPENIETLSHLADGGAYPAVRPDLIAATPIAKPPDGILAHFSSATRIQLVRLAQNERQNRTLAALRDALLPKLISGELHVPEAEKIVEAVS